MKINKWTLGLAAAGLATLPATGVAEEAKAPVLTLLTPTTLYGYVNTSAEWNPGTGNEHVPHFSFNKGKQDGFNLDVVKVGIEKALDDSQWSAGYRAELLFGPDANHFATSSSGEATSDFAIKNAYVALRAPVGNGIDFKMGVWDTIIGYESFDAGSNPNYTRSYGYTIEPTTHTGLLATYQVCKSLSLSGGIANTLGPKINERANPPKTETHKTYLVSAALTAPDDWGFLSGSSLYAGGINGFNQNSSVGGNTQGNLYVGATVNTPCKNLKVGASYDYLGTTDGGTDQVHASAIAGYASFQASEKLSLHARGEFASTDTGMFVTGGSTSSTGSDSKVFAATATLQYDLWKNVLSRLEVRWDHLDDDGQGYGGTDGSSANKEDYFTVALNVIYKF